MRLFAITLVSGDRIRLTDEIAARSLADAFVAVERARPVVPGDRLLVGAAGFPPLWYECTDVRLREGTLAATWRPIVSEGMPTTPVVALPAHIPGLPGVRDLLAPSELNAA